MKTRTNQEMVKSYHNPRLGMGEALMELCGSMFKAREILADRMNAAKTDQARWCLNKVLVGLKAYVNYYW